MTAPPTMPPPAAPMLRRTRPADRAGVTVSALVLLVVAAVVMVVLVMRPSGTHTEHFVRAFSDPNGYAGGVSAPAVVTEHVAAAQPGRHASGSTDRILTMKGGWTSDIGLDVARRAQHWLGTPYSFAGGTYTGPTYGTPVDEASRNDGHVNGFDCSGLVMYALAPYMRLTHFAASQYVEAGQVHPSLNQLQPGDLIFWSKNGTVEGVGHVAVYIGDGNVVQAPESGDVVKITPLNQVEAAAIGTTRPLTTL